MGNIKITDGYQGIKHITSQEVQFANNSIWGMGDRLLSSGEQLRAEVISNNKIRIHDGMMSLQGCRCGIMPGEYVDLTIENGIAGNKRLDIVYLEYTKDATSLKEEVNLKVKKGVEGIAYSAPQLTSGDILGGAFLHQAGLKYVYVDGLSISAVTDAMQPDMISQNKTAVEAASYPLTDSSLKSIYGSTATMKDVLAKLGVDYIIGRDTINGFERVRYSSKKQVVSKAITETVAFTSAWGSSPLFQSDTRTYSLSGLGFTTVDQVQIQPKNNYDEKSITTTVRRVDNANLATVYLLGYTTEAISRSVTAYIRIEGKY